MIAQPETSPATDSVAGLVAVVAAAVTILVSFGLLALGQLVAFLLAASAGSIAYLFATVFEQRSNNRSNDRMDETL